MSGRARRAASPPAPPRQKGCARRRRSSSGRSRDDLHAPGDLDPRRRPRRRAAGRARRGARAPRRRRRRSSAPGSRGARGRLERLGDDDPGAGGGAPARAPRGRPGRAPASRPARTTASFSPAMSRTVGPSQRVCSSPTLVSTTTGAPSTFVASCRPPRPASTTATSTSWRASSANAAAVTSSNCVTRSSPSSVRSTLAAAAAARCTAAREGVGRRGRRRRSGSARRSVFRCGDRNAPARTPCASSSAAHIRTVDDLPLVPTTWIAANRSCGLPSDGQQPPHPLEPEAHAEQLEREQVGLGVLEAPRLPLQGLQLPLEACRACRARPRRRRPAPWRRSPGWRACPRRARSPSRSVARCARGAARRRLDVDRLGLEHRDVAAGDADRRDRLAAVGRPLDAREPRDVLGGAVVAGRLEAGAARPCRRPRRRGRASRAAPASPRSRARPRSSAASSRSARRPRGSGGPCSRPSAPGMCDQISSVTNGMIGMRERERLARARAAPARRRRGCRPRTAAA